MLLFRDWLAAKALLSAPPIQRPRCQVCLMHLKRDLQEVLLIPEFLSLPALCKLPSPFETITVNLEPRREMGPLTVLMPWMLVVKFQQQTGFNRSKKLPSLWCAALTKQVLPSLDRIGRFGSLPFDCLVALACEEDGFWG